MPPDDTLALLIDGVRDALRSVRVMTAHRVADLEMLRDMRAEEREAPPTVRRGLAHKLADRIVDDFELTYQDDVGAGKRRYELRVILMTEEQLRELARAVFAALSEVDRRLDRLDSNE